MSRLPTCRPSASTGVGGTRTTHVAHPSCRLRCAYGQVPPSSFCPRIPRQFDHANAFRVGGLRAMRSFQGVAPHLLTARRPLSDDIASSLGSSTSSARSRCFVSEHTSPLDVHARRSLRSPLHAGKKHKQLWSRPAVHSLLVSPSALRISVTVPAAWACRFARLSPDLWPSASRRPFKRSQLRVQHLAFQG